MLVELGSRKHQLRLAALERRLDVHQQAYTLWRRLTSAVHDEPTLSSAVQDAQSWWERNCLYLAAEVRMDFYMALLAASQHGNYLRHGSSADVEGNWQVIGQLGGKIEAAVELPPISEPDQPTDPGNVSMTNLGDT